MPRPGRNTEKKQDVADPYPSLYVIAQDVPHESATCTGSPAPDSGFMQGFNITSAHARQRELQRLNTQRRNHLRMTAGGLADLPSGSHCSFLRQARSCGGVLSSEMASARGRGCHCGGNIADGAGARLKMCVETCSGARDVGPKRGKRRSSRGKIPHRRLRRLKHHLH